VEFQPSVSPESFADLPTFEIRDGLRTKFCRPHHRKETLVTISWLDLETPDDLITHVLSHFGSLKSNIQWCKIKQESDESEEAKLLNNILSGERQLWIELDKPLPIYASIDQRKVKIFHLGQKRTCARCQMDGESCPGRANAKQCEENGGEKTNVEIAWKNILTSVGYTEWTGGEMSVDAQVSQEASNVEDPVDDVPPIDGCVGLVLDNLEENMKDEDIKTFLKNASNIKKKTKNDKRTKENKKKSKENLDVVTLARKDFLKNKEKDSDLKELSEKFEFSDDGSDSDAFEDIKNVDDADAKDDDFSTPRFKLSVAKSESRVRSRSLSVKRASSVDANDDDEIQRKQKNMKSGLAAPRSYSSNNKKSLL
jgi:hypothetical protein